MSITAERISRIPRVAIQQRSEPARTTVRPVRLLAGAAWLTQAVVLGVLAYFLLGDATASLLTVIGNGASAGWQVLLSVIGLVVPYIAAAFAGRAVYRDGGSLPLAVAAMAATVLATGLAEMGLTALAILFG